METTEKRFEQDIETFFLSPAGGYDKIDRTAFDVDKCICMDVLCQFIEKTQPKAWAKYLKYYGENAQEKLYFRLEKCISEQGLIYVLRHGIEDLGIKLKVCYFKPETSLNDVDTERYEANILGCTRQFRYSPNNTNTIDMVLSVNGIPVVALELKNQLTGQDYQCAIRQYKTDRSSKEFCFRLDHRFLVYFAVDLYEVWMTTQLKDGSTYFMPFNQGSNGAGVSGGAGNPHNPNGYATHYLWEEVLQRDSLMDILYRFVSHVKEKDEDTGKLKEKLLFPRYHQYDVVRKVLADVKANGSGNNYLIQHSAGSGKSNSIAWIAYRLASIHDANDEGIFDSVIVVTNRVVLDGQLQDTINSFEHKVGLVEAIDDKKNSHSLAEAINDGKKIIISTVQKFLFGYKDMDSYKGKKFAIIIDEAHHCLSDSYQKVLNYFEGANVLGVTATPDRGDMRNLGQYFDSLAYEYTLPQAIKEGYLSPIRAMTIPLKIDRGSVGISAGDFKSGDLDSALDPYLEQIADEMQKYCIGRKTVVFLPLIRTSQKFRDIINSRNFGLKAAEVNGGSEDRAETLAAFDRGEFNVLCNSMLLTEGWDCPSVDCVIVLRPTKVRSLYCQMVGRGTRLAPGKEHLLLLDFLWHTERHELCHPASLICEREEVAQRMTANMEDAAGVACDIEEAAQQAADDVVRDREEALAKQLEAMHKRKKRLVDPLQYEMSIQAEDLSGYIPAFGWEAARPTAKQKDALERLGINPDGIESAGKANLLLDRLDKRRQAGLTTPKQIRFLEGRGFRHVGTWQFEDARRLIDRIAANNWRVPPDIQPATYLQGA